MAASTPAHCSIGASKPYQNHKYSQSNHPQIYPKNNRWAAQKVSLAKPSPSSRGVAKPSAAAPPILHNQNPAFPPLPAQRSDLASDFSGRRRFVSKMHFGRQRTTMGSRHSSAAEEALQELVQLGKDDKGLESVLVGFESKLCGSDDYNFLLRELQNQI